MNMSWKLLLNRQTSCVVTLYHIPIKKGKFIVLSQLNILKTNQQLSGSDASYMKFIADFSLGWRYQVNLLFNDVFDFYEDLLWNFSLWVQDHSFNKCSCVIFHHHYHLLPRGQRVTSLTWETFPRNKAVMIQAVWLKVAIISP